LDVVVPGDAATTLFKLSLAINQQLGAPLMVLVDEYDRAPMNALADGDFLDSSREAHDDAVSVMRELLRVLKALPESDNNRYFVTGIAPVSMSGLSIFNSATHLTLEPNFAALLGFTEAEVKAALEHRAGLQPGSEAWTCALSALREYFNGYNFIGGTEALYNPQEVVQFVEKYERGRHGEVVADREVLEAKIDILLDQNQEFSRSQAHLISRSPDHFRAASHFASKSGAVVQDRVLSNIVASDVAFQVTSYLYYLGRLTLAHSGMSATGDQTFHLPNKATQLGFVRCFLKPSGLNAVRNFTRHPSVETLEQLMAHVILPEADAHRTEADFQHRLAAVLLYYGSRRTPPMLEHHPPDSQRQRMDICLDTPEHVIVIETKKEVAGTKVLKDRCDHRAQKDAEKQALGYAQGFTRAGEARPVFAFAVTLWDDLERPVVTEATPKDL
jgi:Predicted AAA-ATPase